MYKLLFSALALLCCASTIQSATITETAAGSSDFTSLTAALELTDLDDRLDCNYFWCRFTVFAPTDDAFDALGDLKDKLLTPDWVEHLKRILKYHVTFGYYSSDDIQNDGKIYTYNAFEAVNTTVTGSDVMINDATVIIPDIEASNGFIHAIDKVLIPSFMTKDIVATAREAGVFETLLTALETAELTEVLQGEGPFTVFAPTDRAFDKLGEGAVDALLEDTTLLGDILKYHVTNGIVLGGELEDGGSVPTLLDGAEIDVTVHGFFIPFPYLNEKVRVSVTDVLTSNGVIHVIDSVLLPDSATPPEPTVAEILEDDPTLETLTAALKAANLFDTLATEGPFTVFAPSDDAFAALGDDTVAGLLADPDSLAPILTYHAVGAEVLKRDLESGAVETLNGASVLADVGFFRSKINGARIQYFDIKGSNGVVHIINEVLLPPAGNCLEVAEANGLTEFVSAVGAAGLEGDLTNPENKFTIFAPKNAAFEALDATPDQATLATVLSYHVVPTVAAASQLSDGDVLPTLLTDSVINVEFQYYFWFFFGGVFLNGEAEVVATDLLCSNGIIHQIDEILALP